MRMWDAQVPVFAKDFRVVRYDVRGFGETPDPPGDYADHEDIAALFKYLNIDSAVVVGISNGCRIAIDFALAYPEKITKLVLVAPSVGGYSPSILDEWFEQKIAQVEDAENRGDLDLAAEVEAQIWLDGPNRQPTQVDRPFREAAVAMNRRILDIPRQGNRKQLQPPAFGRLNEINAPTLLIIGEYDLLSKFAVADAIEHEIRAIERITMPGTAHLPPMEKPGDFNRIVLNFLKKEIMS